MSEVNPVRWFPQPAGGETLEEVSLRSWIDQAIGSASACWEGLENAGVFDSNEAARISSSLHEHVQQVIDNVIAGTRKEFESPKPTLSDREVALRDARRNLIDADVAAGYEKWKAVKYHAEVAFGLMRWAELLTDVPVRQAEVSQGERQWQEAYRQGKESADQRNVYGADREDLVMHWLLRQRSLRTPGSVTYGLLDQLVHEYGQHADSGLPLTMQVPGEAGMVTDPASLAPSSQVPAEGWNVAVPGQDATG